MPTPSPSLLPRLFRAAIKEKASDLHLTANQIPIVRVTGLLKPIKNEAAASEKMLLTEIRKLLTPLQWAAYEGKNDIDLSTELPTGERFRINVYWKQRMPALAARTIPGEIPTLDDLEAPEAILDFVELTQGLVLVTGPTGAGKSTLLASMLERVNQNRVEHIVTLEDPIEFIYKQKKSLISQRELGTDFPTFDVGLKHVFRQDPNVILIGELRDPESIAAALTLAETGHLVFSTLHTNSATETVERLVDAFPAVQQQQIRLQISMVLRAVIAQLLLPTVDGGLTPAHEVLVNTHAVANIIREGKTQQLRNTILTSTKDKMVDLDQELELLIKEGVISKDVARAHAHNPRDFA